MPLTSRFAAAALFAGIVLALPSLRAADTLVWSNTTYTYNSSQAATPTTAATPGTIGTVNGNTLSISYGTASYFNNSSATQPSPAVGTYVTGGTTTYTDGGTGGSKALQIFANFDNGANIVAGAGIPVTVFFSKPVSNLMFSFYDVDGTSGTSNFTDYITNISGTSLLNTTVAPVTLTPTAGFNTSSLSATAGSFTGGTTNAAQNSANGNAAVAFGSTPITQFTFTYTDTAANPGGTAHSTTQIIALGNLTFTTVPEPSAWACAAVAGGLGLLTLRRRARRTA